MDISKIKLEILRRIIDAEETELPQKVSNAYKEFCSDCNNSDIREANKQDTILAYRKDGHPLTAIDLKRELLEITEEANQGLAVHHRLNDILWL